MFSLYFISLDVKFVTPRTGHFWPQQHNLNHLGKGPLDDAPFLVVKPTSILH